MYRNIINWLEESMSECFYHKHFGIECPGCGMQRSIIAFLKGEFVDSFLLYPALLPTIFTIVFVLLHIIFKFKNGARIIIISFIFTVAIILINYIIKAITGNI